MSWAQERVNVFSPPNKQDRQTGKVAPKRHPARPKTFYFYIWDRDWGPTNIRIRRMPEPDRALLSNPKSGPKPRAGRRPGRSHLRAVRGPAGFRPGPGRLPVGEADGLRRPLSNRLG